MPDIDIRRTHQLGLSAARTAAERMADQLGRKFDLRGDWQGNVLNFQRPGVTGSLAVSDKDVHLSVSLGLLLKAMKGSIERAVQQQMDEIFEARAASPAGKAPKPAKAPPKRAR